MKSVYRYIRGGECASETVEFDLLKTNGEYITTCVANVRILECGIRSFPCGNGDDYQASDKERLEMAEFIKAEREKILAGYPVKTYKGWSESGINDFNDYAAPLDEVDEEMVEYFLNSVPPRLQRAGFIQAGEPYTDMPTETGKYRPVYITFVANGSKWTYCGLCHFDKTVDTKAHTSSLDRMIKELRAEEAKS